MCVLLIARKLLSVRSSRDAAVGGRILDDDELDDEVAALGPALDRHAVAAHHVLRAGAHAHALRRDRERRAVRHRQPQPHATARLRARERAAPREVVAAPP